MFDPVVQINSIHTLNFGVNIHACTLLFNYISEISVTTCVSANVYIENFNFNLYLQKHIDISTFQLNCQYAIINSFTKHNYFTRAHTLSIYY